MIVVRNRRSLLLPLVLAVVAVLASGCSDPTASDEYRALESSLEAVKDDLAEATAEAVNLQTALKESEDHAAGLESDLGAAAERADGLQSELDNAESELGVLQSELEELSQPFEWPPEAVQGFVDGCTLDGTSEEECACLFEAVEVSLGMSDFMLLAFNPDAAFEDPEIATAILQSGLSCIDG